MNKAYGGQPAFVGCNLLHMNDPDGAEPNALLVEKSFGQAAAG